MSVELGHEYPLPCPGFHAQGLSRGCQEHGLEKDAAPPRALGTSVSDVPFVGFGSYRVVLTVLSQRTL